MCKKCCLNCRHYAYWDGDFVCVDKMEIVSCGDRDNNDRPLDLDNLTKWRLFCFGYRRADKLHRKINKEVITNLTK